MLYVHQFLSAICGTVGLFAAYLTCTSSFNFLTGFRRVLRLQPGYSVRDYPLKYITGPADMSSIGIAGIPKDNLTYHPNGVWFFQSWFAFERMIDYIVLNSTIAMVTGLVSFFSYKYIVWVWF